MACVEKKNWPQINAEKSDQEKETWEQKEEVGSCAANETDGKNNDAINARLIKNRLLPMHTGFSFQPVLKKTLGTDAPQILV